MRYLHLLVCLLVVTVLVVGCGSGGYRDEALHKQARRSLQRIAAALEQYRLENESYPPGGSDLGLRLEKYFVATDTAGNVTNEWPSMVELSFWGEIEYETPDSLYSYIIKVRARDTRRRPLTVRSNRKPEPKEKTRRR